MAALSLRTRAMAILWPAFLMAGVLEMLVFALVDPGNLHGIGGAPLAMSRSGVYTLAFFVFWTVIALAGALTQKLLLSAEEVNRTADSATPPA